MWPTRLGHAVELVEGDVEAHEEIQGFASDWGGAGEAVPAPVEP